MVARAWLCILLLGGSELGTGTELRTSGELRLRQATEPQKLQILTDTLPDAIVGRRYRVRLRASGGQESYIWNLHTPSLPEGLSLDESSGEIAGTAVSPGLHDFTIRVTDSSLPAETASRYFTLAVAEPLVLQTSSLPKVILQTPYRVRLRASGGTPPLKWDVADGSLPTGLDLEAASELVIGTPTKAGEFRFTVQVTDTSKPPQTQRRTLIAKVVAELTVDWKRPPQVEAGGIYGSVQVSNATQDDFDLTLIVVGVNEYGKAFALGYRQFTLKKETMSQEFPFGFPLPQGEYVVHLDAVAEVASKGAIYRARLQEGPFQIE